MTSPCILREISSGLAAHSMTAHQPGARRCKNVKSTGDTWTAFSESVGELAPQGVKRPRDLGINGD